MNLTDRQSASGVSETDLIHVVITGDTSQSPYGSSYKVEIGKYTALFTSPDTFVTGGTYSSGTTTFRNNTGGTFNVIGFSTGSTSYWSGGTGTNAIATLNGNNTASGNFSLATGYQTTAGGSASHAEGLQTIASGISSHSEGQNTLANGYASHAEGYLTTASGDYSHAQGQNTKALANFSHAEGNYTTASGISSHAEGNNTIASGYSSHAEGQATKATGQGSHAEGQGTIANGPYSHAEGSFSQSNGFASHAEGQNTIANGQYSHAEGNGTTASGQNSHAGGVNTIASGYTSFVHGNNSRANGNNSIVLGRNITGSTADTTYVDNLNIKSVPTGTSVSSLGIDASGNVIASSASGSGTDTFVTGGTYSSGTTTLNNNTGGTISITGYSESPFISVDEGSGVGAVLANREPLNYGPIGEDGFDISWSSGPSSSFGATGTNSFAQGYDVIASGSAASCFGDSTTAGGDLGFVTGRGGYEKGYGNFITGAFNIVTDGAYATVVGQFADSITNNIGNVNDGGNTMFAVGNGTADGGGLPQSRSTAFKVFKSGLVVAPSLTNSLISGGIGTTLITKDYCIEKYASFGVSEPTGATDTGIVGEIRMTSAYTYTCIATNTWVRSVAATW